jgi:hypothetical protein
MVTRQLEILYFALQIFSIASLSVLTYTFLFGLKQPGASKPNPLLAGYYCLFCRSLSVVAALILVPIQRIHLPTFSRALSAASCKQPCMRPMNPTEIFTKTIHKFGAWRRTIGSTVSSAGCPHAGLLASSQCTCTLTGIDSTLSIILVPIITVLIESPLGVEIGLVGSQ